MARIEILSGPESGQTLDLGPGRHLLGRHSSVDVRLHEETISSRHLELTLGEDGTVRFRDLGSTNGTWSGGVKVEQGEWFPGSELRVGSCRLRLLEEGAAPGPAGASGDSDAALTGSDAALHRRALDQAMASKRRGGPLMLLGLVVLVAAAGAVWWFFGREGAEPEGPGQATAAGGATAASGPRSLLEGYEELAGEDAEAWRLGRGVTIEGGRLRSEGGRRRAALTVRFPVSSGSLRIAAQLEGLRAWPVIEWGAADAEAPIGALAGSGLGGGAVEVGLPEEADWFSLALRLDGAGAVAQLGVEAGERALALQRHDIYAYLSEGGNLDLRHRDGSWLAVQGAGGSWSSAEGGLDFTASSGGSGWLQFAAPAATLATGPFWILSEGGPQAAVSGAVVEDSPGLLVGAEARRLLIRFAEPLGVVVADGAASVEGLSGLTLRWDFATPFAETARVARQMNRAAQDGDDRAMLAASAELLRLWPLEEEQVQRALDLRRAAIVRGRSELGRLEIAAGEAFFLESVPDMRRIEDEARALAGRLPDTDVEREARRIADDLASSREQAMQETLAREAVYRGRLLGVLERNYPVLASWIRENEESGGGR